MNRNKFAVLASLILAMIISPGAPGPMLVQDSKSFLSMAPLNQNLLDRNAEIGKQFVSGRFVGVRATDPMDTYCNSQSVSKSEDGFGSDLTERGWDE